MHPVPPVEARPLAGAVLMIVGGAFSLALSGFWLLALGVCLNLAGAACVGGLVPLTLLPATGALAIAFGALSLLRPHRHRLYGGVVLAAGLGTFAVGVFLLSGNVTAVLIVLLFYAWPLLLILAGALLGLAWRPLG